MAFISLVSIVWLCWTPKNKQQQIKAQRMWTYQWLMLILPKLSLRFIIHQRPQPPRSHEKRQMTNNPRNYSFNGQLHPKHNVHKRFELTGNIHKLGDYIKEVLQKRNAEGYGCCTESFVKTVMGKCRHTAGRGAGVGSERPGVRANEQAKMDDGWCWYRRQQPCFI